MAKPSVPKKIAENEFLDIIRKNQPISVYKLRKLTSYLSYSGVLQYINELEAKEKIRTRFRIGENNRTERIVWVEEKVNDKIK